LNTTQWFISDATAVLDFYPDLRPHKNTHAIYEHAASFNSSESKHVIIRMRNDFQSNSGERNIFFLPLLTCEHSNSPKSRMYGLALIPCEGVKGQFIRVGRFETDDHASKSIVSGPSTGVEDNYYHEFDGVNQYTITVI